MKLRLESLGSQRNQRLGYIHMYKSYQDNPKTTSARKNSICYFCPHLRGTACINDGINANLCSLEYVYRGQAVPSRNRMERYSICGSSITVWPQATTKHIHSNSRCASIAMQLWHARATYATEVIMLLLSPLISM